MPVLEEAKTIVYVTNHNMITMAMAIFKTYKMADKREERVLTEILARLFLFHRVFFLSSPYYELGNTLRTRSNHSCAIVLRLYYCALWRHFVLTAYVISTSKIGKHASKFVPISFINFLYHKKKECFGNN